MGAAKNTVSKKNLNGTVTPNMIASRIVKMSNAANVSRGRKKFVKDALRVKKKLLKSDHQYSRPFDSNEVQLCVESLKVGKAAGADNIYPEFIRNLGDRAKKWLTDFMNDILSTRNIPREFHRSKVVVILEPKKPENDPASYRPISLLSVCVFTFIFVTILRTFYFNLIFPCFFCLFVWSFLLFRFVQLIKN